MQGKVVSITTTQCKVGKRAHYFKEGVTGHSYVSVKDSLQSVYGRITKDAYVTLVPSCLVNSVSSPSPHPV